MKNNPNIQIAIASIAWSQPQPNTNEKKKPLETLLEKIKKANFDGCELTKNFPRDPFLLQHSMKSQGLSVSSAPFHSCFTDEKKYTQSIDQFIDHMHFLNAINAKTIIISECGHNTFETSHAVISDKPIFKATQWKLLITGLKKISGYAKENNMRIVYQPHLGTGIKTEADIDHLMASTTADEVSLLIDTGHLAALGIDTKSVINKYIDRIHYIHLRDVDRKTLNTVKKNSLSYCEAMDKNLFVTPGKGFIHFEGIYKLLNKNQYKGWLVIHGEEGIQKTTLAALARSARKHFTKDKS